MNYLRTLIHALLVLALSNVANLVVQHAQRPGLQELFTLLKTGAFLPFAVATAAAMNHQRSLILPLLTFTLLIAWPFTIQDLPALLTPIALGVIIGSGLRHLLRNEPAPTSGGSSARAA